jgi:hypothetical protein
MDIELHRCLIKMVNGKCARHEDETCMALEDLRLSPCEATCCITGMLANFNQAQVNSPDPWFVPCTGSTGRQLIGYQSSLLTRGTRC